MHHTTHRTHLLALLPTALLLLAALALPATRLAAWARLGHDTTTAIAEQNLTPKARAAVEKYLDGRSIIYFASWMDEVRATPEYKHTNEWHMGQVDENLRSTPAARRQKGDAVTALENTIATLKNHKTLDRKTVVDNIKYLIHLVGDMHCPGHVYFPGINNWFNVTLLGKKTTYHAVWDSELLNSIHNWSYSEYARHLDRATPAERKTMSAGAPADWFHETAKESRVIYTWGVPDAVLDRNFTNAMQPLAESQLQKAGYRLARLLNELFE